MRTKLICFFLVAANFLTFAQTESAEGKVLRFLYKTGDTSRIVSTVEEDVIVNGVFNHHAVILNRVSVTIDEAEGDIGNITATFMTSEKSNDSSGSAFSWEQDYTSVFKRDRRGVYDIADEYFMPVVRDVPVFPDYAVSPGDTWVSEGHEAHDLRTTFGIDTPFKIPFEATYTYDGTHTDSDGKMFDVINVRYNIYYESPRPHGMSREAMLYSPASTMGYSNQTLYWDNEHGILDHYNEEFRIVITTFFGDEFIFDGTANAKTDEFTRTNTEENLQAVQEAIEQLGLENVTVTQGERGLTISIENIQFLPESSVLMDSEKEKLNRMSEIFAAYSNDLLITGYTALSGTVQGRKQLSQERAQSVAEYLISQNVRQTDSIFTEGKGAANPVATNDTAEGRARNRRVEITFLD